MDINLFITKFVIRVVFFFFYIFAELLILIPYILISLWLMELPERRLSGLLPG